MRRELILFLGVAVIGVLIISLLVGCGQKPQQTATPVETTAAPATENGWAVCAYDGMVMKEAGMGATAEYEGKTLYFCNDDHKERFMANPGKYQRTWTAFGHDASFNILPMAAHMAAMRDMGMTMDMPHGMTHHATLCLIATPERKPVTDVIASAKLASPGGKEIRMDMPLAADGKHYAADVKLSESGEYKVEVTLSQDGNKEVRALAIVVE